MLAQEHLRVAAPATAGHLRAIRFHVGEGPLVNGAVPTVVRGGLGPGALGIRPVGMVVVGGGEQGLVFPVQGVAFGEAEPRDPAATRPPTELTRAPNRAQQHSPTRAGPADRPDTYTPP